MEPPLSDWSAGVDAQFSVHAPSLVPMADGGGASVSSAEALAVAVAMVDRGQRSSPPVLPPCGPPLAS